MQMLYNSFVAESEIGFILKSHPSLYTRDIMPKRVTSGKAHLRGLAPRQHGSEETSPWCRNRLFDLGGPRIKPKTSRADSDVGNLVAKISFQRKCEMYEEN